jgi:hypothetical protein
MFDSQKNKIIKLLLDGQWHCTSEFYALFMADPRRRICDLKEDGYIFEEPRRCQQHDYHRGGSKEWRLKEKDILLISKTQYNIHPPLKIIEEFPYFKREVLQGKLI